jgi:hypothetical protein
MRVQTEQLFALRRALATKQSLSVRVRTDTLNTALQSEVTAVLECTLTEAVSTSETSASFYQTTRVSVPKDSLATHRRENRKSRHV